MHPLNRKRPYLILFWAGLSFFALMALTFTAPNRQHSLAWAQTGPALTSPNPKETTTPESTQGSPPAKAQAEPIPTTYEEQPSQKTTPAPAKPPKLAKTAPVPQVPTPLDWKRGVIESIAILVLTFLLMKAMNVVVRRVIIEHKEDATPAGQRARTLAGILISTGRYVLFLIAALMVLSSFEINITPILAGVGFLGLAVGFGAQAVVRDLISGFFILFEDHFSIGDTVELSGIHGTVEEMGLRSTTIRSYDGTLHIVPNGSIATVSNLSRGYARAVIDVALPATVPLEKVSSLLQEVARKSHQEIQGLMEEPQVLGIETLSRTEMTIRISARVIPAQRDQVARALRERINQALQSAGLLA